MAADFAFVLVLVMSSSLSSAQRIVVFSWCWVGLDGGVPCGSVFFGERIVFAMYPSSVLAVSRLVNRCFDVGDPSWGHSRFGKHG